MAKFEAGKRYEALSGSSIVFEIVKRTAKRITYVEIQHEGRYNEYNSEPKTVAIRNWKTGEAFYTRYGATIVAY